MDNGRKVINDSKILKKKNTLLESPTPFSLHHFPLHFPGEMEPIGGEAHLLCIPTQASCEVHTLFCPPPASEDGWDPPARLLFRLLLRAPSVSSEAHFSQSPLLSFPHFPTACKNPQVLTQGTLSLEVACSFLYLFPPQTRESVAHSADSLTSSLEVTFWFHHFTQNALTKLTKHRPAARGHGPFTVMVL